MTKRWEIITKDTGRKDGKVQADNIIKILLANRGIAKKSDVEEFLNPKDPLKLTSDDVGIDKIQLKNAVARIKKAIKDKESVVVYADYDADGITAGAVMWEALYKMGTKIMPYIPHRVEEGYGLSRKGIDAVMADFNPRLIITVDHGITGREMVEYAAAKGIDVIVTDHHVKPKSLPDCITVHTTDLSGSGISWFVAKSVSGGKINSDMLAISSIGTVADMVPLLGANRSIVKFGLEALNRTRRVGLKALIKEAGLEPGKLGTYDISHILAPRLNAMGRLVHAMDALRLLCTKNPAKAEELAAVLGTTNKERQQLTTDTAIHALETARKNLKGKRLIFVAAETYNQGIIGLVAGRLVEEYYLPSIVVTKGKKVSKASARSVSGFNIVEAIRGFSDLLVDVGGHPMAAGFTVETKNLEILQKKLEEFAEKELDGEKLQKILHIDMEIPLEMVTEKLWEKIQTLAPFGMGNYEPVFVTKGVMLNDVRLVGREGKHLKLKVSPTNCELPTTNYYDCIGFNLGDYYSQLLTAKSMDIAYTIDMNYWNGNEKLQLKLRDVRVKKAK